MYERSKENRSTLDRNIEGHCLRCGEDYQDYLTHLHDRHLKSPLEIK